MHNVTARIAELYGEAGVIAQGAGKKGGQGKSAVKLRQEFGSRKCAGGIGAAGGEKLG